MVQPQQRQPVPGENSGRLSSNESPKGPSSRGALMVGGLVVAGLLAWLALSSAIGDRSQEPAASVEPALSGAAAPATTLPSTTLPSTTQLPTTVPPTAGLDPALVEISGDPLPPMEGGGLETAATGDNASGLIAPTLSGFGLDGEPVSIGPDGTAKAVVFVAHWCPHCQSEVPQIIDLANAGLLPEGVQVYAVSTAVDPTRGNFPPQDWLDREGWTFPVIRDTDQLALFDAFGGTGFPYAVYLDGDNRVVARSIGSLDVTETLAAWELLAN